MNVYDWVLDIPGWSSDHNWLTYIAGKSVASIDIRCYICTSYHTTVWFDSPDGNSYTEYVAPTIYSAVSFVAETYPNASWMADL